MKMAVCLIRIHLAAPTTGFVFNFEFGSGGQCWSELSCLDFTFVIGEAKSWSPKSSVIIHEGNFPDDETTSDHRPVELSRHPGNTAVILTADCRLSVHGN